jgi:hypothetical protein
MGKSSSSIIIIVGVEVGERVAIVTVEIEVVLRVAPVSCEKRAERKKENIKKERKSKSLNLLPNFNINYAS